MEKTKQSFGVSVQQRKMLILIAGSLLTGSAVAVSGTIGFVGLVIPHITRLLWGTDHRHLLPLSALLGAGFLVLADLLSRTIIEPIELPIGIITSLAGAPVFALILIRQQRGEKLMMKAEGLSGGYGDSRLINNVSLTVEKGEFLGILGLMGAEKPRFCAC